MVQLAQRRTRARSAPGICFIMFLGEGCCPVRRPEHDQDGSSEVSRIFSATANPVRGSRDSKTNQEEESVGMIDGFPPKRS